MLKVKVIHWPIFFASMGVILLAARLLSGGFGVLFWITFAVLVVAVLLNGVIAILEDELPGGFNNPELQDQGHHSPKDKGRAK